MSDFSSLTLVFNKGDHFHTVSVDDGHSAYDLISVYDRFVNADWELVSAVVDCYQFQYEALKDLSRNRDVIELFEQLTDAWMDSDTICAWLSVDESANFSNMEGSLIAEGSDYSTIWEGIQEWEENHLPSWVVVDESETVDQYANYHGYSLVSFEGRLYLFDLNY